MNYQDSPKCDEKVFEPYPSLLSESHKKMVVTLERVENGYAVYREGKTYVFGSWLEMMTSLALYFHDAFYSRKGN